MAASELIDAAALGDRAALAVEAEVGDLAVPDHDVHAQLVAAERVMVVELEVVGLEHPEVPRVLVVIEDVVPVQGIHGQPPSPKTFAGAVQGVNQPVHVLA